jgi:very-short-patch-repair endonuclease
MWLFYSSTSNHLSERCFRRRLLDFFINPTSQIAHALGETAEELREIAYKANRAIEKAPAPFDSWFEVDVALHIASRGYRVIPQYEFAGKRIDLVVQGNKSQLAVECYGDYWHGADEYNADMERQRKLERCGWQFFIIRECHYYSDPEKGLEMLWDQLNKMGIMPLHGEPDQSAEDEEDIHDDEDVSESTESSEDEIDLESTIDTDVVTEEKIPKDIHQAIRVKNELICKTIIHVLKERPKYSCVKENLTTYILKKWNIRTRGTPRDQFAKKVYRQIAVMERKGYIIVYTSKNVRVKLGWVSYPGLF